MVKKMKLKFSFVILLVCFISFGVKAEVVRCGTNLSTKAYAYKEEGKWKGFDADICRTFAWAMYGDGNKFEMVDVRSHEILPALQEGKIDIMLSNNVSPITMEAKRRASEVGLLYYDRQMFAVKDAPEEISSMKDFNGKKVCVYAGAGFLDNLKSYNKEHKLGFKLIAFKSLRKARNAFLLKRCELFSMQGLQLQSIIADSPGKGISVLPEEFAHKGVYAYVSYKDNGFRVLAKWVINALYAAEQMGLNKDNAMDFVYKKTPENLNLFGERKALWSSLSIRPDWLRLAVADVGNIGEVFERNLGSQSDYKLKRGDAALIKDGGSVFVEPFK